MKSLQSVTMSKNFIPVLIFITIYTKSCYTFPSNNKNHNVDDSNYNKNILGRAINSIYDSVNKLTYSNPEPKNILTSLYYNVTSRRFYFFNKHDSEARSNNNKINKNKYEPPGYFDSMLDFFSGLFFEPFSVHDRKPPKIKKIKPKINRTVDKDYDNDPISNFFDGLEDMFQKPKPKIKTSTASPSTWFGWYDDYDQSYETSSAENGESSQIIDRMDSYTTTPKSKPNKSKPIKKKSTDFSAYNPTTISYEQFMDKKTNLKQNDKNGKDCPDKKPNSWMPDFFGSSNTIETTTHTPTTTTTTSGTGWFSFFTGSDNDDNDDDTESTEPSTSWFGSFFSDDVSTKAPIRATTAIPTTSTTLFPSPPGWFDTFINAEDDDGAYSSNTSNRQKKGRRKNYKGYQLLRLYPNNVWKVNSLKDLQEDTQGSGLMWWSSPALNRSADLLVPPDLLADVKDHLNGEGMQYDVVIWDLQKAITYENPKLSKMQRLELESKRGHPLTWRRYHRYSDILRYLEFLSLKYSDMVNLIPFGRSSEGLPIMGAKVSFPINETEEFIGEKKKWKLKSRMKPAIWIDGGMHAREWISPAVVTWILHALVEGEHGSGAEMDMLKIADWYILPVVNPDGYEFTHTKDRLWRKSRSVHPGSDVYYNSWFPWNWGNTECIGVDLNRNWDYHWGEKGASNDPCSDNYAGPNPFSDPETRSISNFIMENKDQMKVYLSLHAYSQMWALPSTHSKEPFVDNAELMEMGKLALNALKDVSGTKYEIGSLSELLLPITGTSHDWAKGRAAIKYSYAVKMRDSRGPYGFLLPGSQITPTAKETWEAIKTVADNL